jgi:chromate transporter
VTGLHEPSTGKLSELARVFLRLGTTAFGGPAAHIAMMEEEVVRRRQWISREEFLDLLGATHLIPGPNSTEMAIHIGLRRAGWRGLLVAGTCFIMPAVVLVTAIAWIYVRFGALPQAEALLHGIKPVIIAIILQALLGLAKTAVKSPMLALLGVVAAFLNFCGVGELAVLFGAGALLVILQAVIGQHRGHAACLLPILGGGQAATVATVSIAAPFSMAAMFWFFLKVGAVLFGSGYVLLAFLRADLVEERQWLTSNQLLDAVAVGQMTPGPVFTTATFIGYLLAGPQGAMVATIAIFLPAFFFVAISGPLLPWLRRSAVAGAFLDGVNVAALALMAVVTWRLGVTAITDPLAAVLAVVAAVLLLRVKLNSGWLVLGGGLIGLVASMFR